jgi:hypothetical protein
LTARTDPKDERRASLPVYWLRILGYYLTRPSALVHPVTIDRPVAVVGSAPISTRPQGFGPEMMVFTINGSQSVAAAWGTDVPDVTFMQFNQIEGQGANAQAVRRVLNGRRTRRLCVIRWKKDCQRLQRGLRAFAYTADDLVIVGRDNRVALYHQVMGKPNFERDNHQKYSNGITAVLYAFASGAPAVIITGIDPTSTGHVYNDLNLKRLHASTDLEVLQTLHRRGLPLYTADAHVAQKTGLPIWPGGTRGD